MGDYLIYEAGGKIEKLPAKIFLDAKSLRPLFSQGSWDILKLLSSRAYYPAEIAKKLGIHEQRVYYYIKQLKAAKLIELAKTEEMQGALAKYYRAKHNAFALLVSKPKAKEGREFSVSAPEKENSSVASAFFYPFIKEGVLDTRIVVGSPDAHGKYKARARDTHLVAELCTFLGSLCTKLNYPLVWLDTMVPSLKECDSNLIIIGGPLTNKLCGELNNKLSVRFEPSGGHWMVSSELSGKNYNEDAVGIIEKVAHPYYKDKEVLLVAGNRNSGTRAAVIALIKNLEEVSSPNPHNKEVNARVVEGLDVDGDGVIDEVEVKE